MRGEECETVSLENFVEKANQLHPADKRLINLVHEIAACNWLLPFLGPLTAEGFVPWTTATRIFTGISKPKRAEAKFKSYFENSFRTPCRLKDLLTPREGDTPAFLNQCRITWGVVQRRYKNGFPLRDFYRWSALIDIAHQNKIKALWRANLKRFPKKKVKISLAQGYAARRA
jgi:hypothetical protein